MTPEWIDAPEGYDVWIVDKEGQQPAGWYREQADHYVDQDGFFWRKAAARLRSTAAPCGAATTSRPLVAAASTMGSGGLVWGTGDEAEVLAHYSPTRRPPVMVVFAYSTTSGGRLVGQALPDCFSPFPDPAVVEALDEIERLYREGGPAAVWDAGYRRAV